METWTQYSKIKLLVDHYWELKDVEKYDEFIGQLLAVLKL